MRTFQRIFSGVRTSYLIRAYIIGAIFFLLMASVSLSAQAKNGTPYGAITFAALSTVLFPFAKLVWDELRDLAIGNNMIFMNAILLFMLKWFVNAFLWTFAIFVAPLGVLYLWFRTRQPEVMVEDQP